MECPYQSFLPRCRCVFDNGPVISMHGCTYYTGIGMLSFNDALYVYQAHIGPHFIETVMHAIGMNRLTRHGFNDTKFAYVSVRSHEENMGFVVSFKGRHSTISYLRRIQRFVRVFLRSRREIRFIAMAMGLHPRLGAQSSLHCLCSDVMGETIQL